jgi:hypothetical protein
MKKFLYYIWIYLGWTIPCFTFFIVLCQDDYFKRIYGLYNQPPWSNFLWGMSFVFTAIFSTGYLFTLIYYLAKKKIITIKDE